MAGGIFVRSIPESDEGNPEFMRRATQLPSFFHSSRNSVLGGTVRVFASIATALSFFLILGCDQSKRLDRVDLDALNAEAQTLMDQATQRDKANGSAGHVSGTYDLPKDEWTPMIKKINPRQVRYMYRGVWLIDSKWVSKENGFFIPPAGPFFTEDGAKPDVEMLQVKPGVYRYHSE